MMIVADDNFITPTDISLRAFKQALEPKELVIIAGDHYDPYLDQFDEKAAALRATGSSATCEEAAGSKGGTSAV